MYHDLLSLPSSPPGLQPTARRPVEPCINRHLPSPPPHCVAHIMSSHPWHCHHTIMRLNYLNAVVIILAPHPARLPEGTDAEPLPHPAAGRVPVRVLRGGVMRASVLRDPPNTGVGGGCFATGGLRLVNRGRML